MNTELRKKILETMNAVDIANIELIQPLWNNYGELLRVKLNGCKTESVIVKYIKIPSQATHPKGFNSSLSKERKVKSYKVEANWYKNHNALNLLDSGSRTPHCYATGLIGGAEFFILEDLALTNFLPITANVTMNVTENIIGWLAHFHAKFLGAEPSDLWEEGTYWHLATRPDEWQKMGEGRLKDLASLIDRRLSRVTYKTFLHGDAKLANFCANADGEVAAVDFQYVGGGCGMKDLAYFVGSVFSDEDCERYENHFLDLYFRALANALAEKKGPDGELISKLIEDEWRPLYRYAATDFQRFLKGWSPNHWKINSYSEKVSDEVCKNILEYLSRHAENAVEKAASFIINFDKKDLKTESKGYEGSAADLVTQVDHQSQKIILENLSTSIQAYDLGVLCEESTDDHSRFEKEYFWAIDPLDGTAWYANDEYGAAVSVCLISKHGKALLSQVYNISSQTLYGAIKGAGVYKNKVHFLKSVNRNREMEDNGLTLVSDKSFEKHDDYERLMPNFHIKIAGGAVCNVLSVIEDNWLYYKPPRKTEGGCAIWDLAGVSLLLSELGGVITDLDSNELSFNNKNIYFPRGFIASPSKDTHKRAIAKLKMPSS